MEKDMIQKLTEARVNSLVETLSALICEDDLLNREQRENMIMTVATLGGMHERLRQVTASKEARKQDKIEKQKSHVNLILFSREPEKYGAWKKQEPFTLLLTICLTVKLIITSSGFQRSLAERRMPLR